MVIFYVLFSTALLHFASASATSFQYVKFIKPTPKLQVFPEFNHRTIQNSFDNFPSDLIDLPDDWPSELLLHDKFPDFQIGRNDHISPDFSNGLDYHDPLLLTGHLAYKAVAYLYGKGELFFHQINHVKSLQRLQEMRKYNGLPPNKYGSLRPYSPFYRYANRYYAG